MTTNTENKKNNRLINQKSPYLLQHAYNPVDWYPWSDEAFEKAKSLDKPVFLSIGYSTCHWCHVMERECFEDQEVADLLNQSFVSIKVDREERPDIDSVYMDVCQALTGQGGWPLTIIMTPDKKPFFAGTYFPKASKMGFPGLIDILQRVTQSWKTDRTFLVSAGETIAQTAQDVYKADTNMTLSKWTIDKAFEIFKSIFDNDFGGFGSAPKFPSAHNLSFLLRYWKTYQNNDALRMVEKTIQSMYSGGIFDHIGFGFSRYSTDNEWLVPHFEKMLYDNALIATACLETYQATSNALYAEIAEKIFTYVLRDMTSPEGGFYSAEDADSEGVEGKFYLWTPDEVNSVLGKENGELFCRYYKITKSGNFEGKSIPNLIFSGIDDFSSKDMETINICRRKLFEHREKRVHPYKDDKILTSWNGLMISALALGSRVLGNKEYCIAAEKAASFIFEKLFDNKTKKLYARFRDGESAYEGYAYDYALIISGLIELYQTTYKPEYLKKALELNSTLLKYFWDEENGGLYLYSSEGEQLISRPKEIYDGAIPSANSVSTLNFLKLSKLTEKNELSDLAQKQFKFFAETVRNYPSGYSYFLTALLYSLTPVKEIVIAGQADLIDTQSMLRKIYDIFLPNAIVHLNQEGTALKELTEIIPFIENQKAIGNNPTAYVCENYSCNAPTTNIETLEHLLQQ